QLLNAETSSERYSCYVSTAVSPNTVRRDVTEPRPLVPVVELLRVSTEAQAAFDRAGLPAQHATNVRTCEAYGLSVIESIEVVETGVEVAQSAEMQRIMDLIVSGTARGVVLAEYSRLFRPDRWSDL